MKKIKIIICGGLGRMGKVLIKQINKNKKFLLKGITDIKEGSNLKNIKITKNSLDTLKNADVIIDFSMPDSSLEVIKYAYKLKKKLVIGTTGFSKKQNNLIKKYSKKIAIFKSGNMSMGVNFLEYIVNIISKKIPNNYYIGIYDNHHKKKIDYPSGTALMLANAISTGRGKKLNSLKGKIFLNKKGNLQKIKLIFLLQEKEILLASILLFSIIK